jgi:PAS domain S-box-containing protein
MALKLYRALLPYGIALGSTALALWLSLWFGPLMNRSIGTFFYMAIITSTWYGGLRPGIVSIVLSFVALDIFLIAPLGQFQGTASDDWIRLGIFTVVSLVISFLTSNLRYSKRKVEKLSRQLQAESADRLKVALTAAQMGMWDWDLVSGEISWSPEHEQLFGFAPGQFDGRYETFDAHLHPEDRPGLNQAVTHALQNRVPYQHEFRVIWADGSIHWIEGRGHALYDAAGNPVRMSGTVMAIDQRKQTEIKLQEQEALLRLFARSAPAGIAMFDCEMRYVMASQRWVDSYGLDSVESLIGRSHYEVFPELPERWRQVHQRCLAGAVEKCDEDQFVRLNGMVQWFAWEARPWYRAMGEIGGIIIFSVDITPRKQTEFALQQLNAELEQRIAERTGELRATNDRLLATLAEQQQTQLLLLEKAQLLDLAHDTIMTCDLNATITFWNRGAELMYGWSKAETTGQNAHELLKTEYPLPLVEIQALLFKQGYWEGELVHWNRAGQRLVVASRWVLQTDDLGRPMKILEINNDITVQKQSEQALQQYAAEVEDLYNHAPCGYHSLDGDGMVIRMNETELNWLGYAAEEVLGRKQFVDLITPQSRAVFAQSFSKLKQQGWIHDLEFQLLSKDGHTRWVSFNSTAIYDEVGNFVMSRSTVFDITDRKRTETERQQIELALKVSEERLRLSLDLTHIGSWDMHLPSQAIVWNDNHFTLLGLQPNQHKPCYELWRSCVHPDDLPWVEQKYVESIQNQTDYAAEYRVVYPDGSAHWLMARARAIVDAMGHPLRSIGVLLDITERKQIEASLRQSEETFRSLSEFSPTGIFLCDAGGRCIYTNPRFDQIVGCTAAEALHEGWLCLVHPEDRDWVMAEWQAIVAAGREGDIDNLRYQNHQGRICYTHVRLVPIKTTDGTVNRFVGVMEDVTAQREIDRMKQEFISVVSHELRTPLTSIRGALGLVAGGIYDKKPEKKQEMIKIAARQSDRLVRLVNDILDLRRLESGQARFEFQSCAAIDLMQQSVDVMRSQADQGQISLMIMPTAAVVWADADAMVQTLTNLLSNAIKFSPPHSTITLSATAEGLLTCFSVQDQGRGIPADQLKSIFGQFQQVDASDSREKGGTGLGLAICATIVEQHGGQIWVESAVGTGSTFYFTVPVPSPHYKDS